MAVIYGRDDRNDLLIGTAGEDLIRGLAGDDTIRGLGGNDVLVDGFGNDLVLGGDGDDIFINISGSDDTFDGGAGFDVLFDDLRGFDLDLLPSLEINLATDFHLGDRIPRIEGFEMKGITPIDGTGDAGRNLFVTARGADTLRGQGGADTLDSGNGNDRLFGGNGKDELIGGKGRDTVTGGKGADTFVFEDGDGKDRYTDFRAAQDTLALDVAFYTIGDSIAEFLVKVATDTGRNVRLDLGGGDQILLVGVRTVASLEDAIEFI